MLKAQLTKSTGSSRLDSLLEKRFNDILRLPKHFAHYAKFLAPRKEVSLVNSFEWSDTDEGHDIWDFIDDHFDVSFKVMDVETVREAYEGRWEFSDSNDDIYAFVKTGEDEFFLVGKKNYEAYDHNAHSGDSSIESILRKYGMEVHE